MSKISKGLSWIYALSGLLCLQVGIAIAMPVFQEVERAKYLPNLFVTALFVAFTAVFEMGWWTILKEKRTARIWGIASGVIFVAVSLWPILWTHSIPWGHFELTLGIGLGGVFISTRLRTLPAESQESTSSVGDCTVDLINRSAQFIGILGWMAALWEWSRWTEANGMHHLGNSILLIGIAGFALSALHEAGHAVAGLSLGMKLRAFFVGPLQWRVREGKWEFKFQPLALLAAGGAAAVVPVKPCLPRWHKVYVIAAGPLTNLFTGMAALWVAFSAEPDSLLQLWGLTAMFGAVSIVVCATNLMPFRSSTMYSDGARVLQLLAGGPWADLQDALTMATSTTVSLLRPRNYDIEVIHRAAEVIKDGTQAVLLRLLAFSYYLDSGWAPTACRVLSEAEEIALKPKAIVPVEFCTLFVFGKAYACRDAAAARQWWDRLEAKKPTRFNVDYWRAKAALAWIEGQEAEARENLDKAVEEAANLPAVGAYDYDRHCCPLRRQAFGETPASGC